MAPPMRSNAHSIRIGAARTESTWGTSIGVLCFDNATAQKLKETEKTHTSAVAPTKTEQTAEQMDLSAL